MHGYPVKPSDLSGACQVPVWTVRARQDCQAQGGVKRGGCHPRLFMFSSLAASVWLLCLNDIWRSVNLFIFLFFLHLCWCSIVTFTLIIIVIYLSLLFIYLSFVLTWFSFPWIKLVFFLISRKTNVSISLYTSVMLPNKYFLFSEETHLPHVFIFPRTSITMKHARFYQTLIWT